MLEKPFDSPVINKAQGAAMDPSIFTNQLTKYVDIDYSHVPVTAEELAAMNDRQIQNIGFGIGKAIGQALHFLSPSWFKKTSPLPTAGTHSASNSPINVNQTTITELELRQLVGDKIFYVTKSRFNQLNSIALIQANHPRNTTITDKLISKIHKEFHQVGPTAKKAMLLYMTSQDPEAKFLVIEENGQSVSKDFGAIATTVRMDDMVVHRPIIIYTMDQHFTLPHEMIHGVDEDMTPPLTEQKKIIQHLEKCNKIYDQVSKALLKTTIGTQEKKWIKAVDNHHYAIYPPAAIYFKQQDGVKKDFLLENVGKTLNFKKNYSKYMARLNALNARNPHFPINAGQFHEFLGMLGEQFDNVIKVVSVEQKGSEHHFSLELRNKRKSFQKSEQDVQTQLKVYKNAKDLPREYLAYTFAQRVLAETFCKELTNDVNHAFDTLSEQRNKMTAAQKTIKKQRLLHAQARSVKYSANTIHNGIGLK